MVGQFAKAGKVEAERAVEALKAFESWREVPVASASISCVPPSPVSGAELNACHGGRQGRSRRRGGRSHRSEYYALDMRRIAAGNVTHPSEDNELRWTALTPRGRAAVEFSHHSLATSAAAVVAGNAVVLKPSSEAAGFLRFSQITERPGCRRVSQPDRPRRVGRQYRDAPAGALREFHRLEEVGLHQRVGRAGAEVDQAVVAEMGVERHHRRPRCRSRRGGGGGGRSAFGYQGQVLGMLAGVVDASVHDAFWAKLKDATAKPESGRRTTGERWSAQRRSRRNPGYIEVGRKEGRLLAGGISSSGHYPPHRVHLVSVREPAWRGSSARCWW